MKDFLIARRLSVAEIPTVAGETQTSLLSSVKIFLSKMEEGDPELKVVMVGPPGSGKSSMILSLTSDAYKNISEHTTTVFDKYCAKVEDSAGQSYQLRCGNPT